MANYYSDSFKKHFLDIKKLLDNGGNSTCLNHFPTNSHFLQNWDGFLVIAKCPTSAE